VCWEPISLLLPCSWKQSVDIEAVRGRLTAVERELVRIRKIPHVNMVTDIVESQVAATAMRGGSYRMSKADAIFELAYEAAELKDRLFLADADKDLHRVFCEAEGVEVTVSMHGGYPQRLPREKAFVMLDSEINRIVAAQVTREIIDDILEWMREGWHFGETPSRVAAAGNLMQLKHQHAQNKAKALGVKGTITGGFEDGDEIIDGTKNGSPTKKTRRAGGGVRFDDDEEGKDGEGKKPGSDVTVLPSAVRPSEGVSSTAIIYTLTGPAARARQADEERNYVPVFYSPEATLARAQAQAAYKNEQRGLAIAPNWEKPGIGVDPIRGILAQVKPPKPLLDAAMRAAQEGMQQAAAQGDAAAAATLSGGAGGATTTLAAVPPNPPSNQYAEMGAYGGYSDNFDDMGPYGGAPAGGRGHGGSPLRTASAFAPGPGGGGLHVNVPPSMPPAAPPRAGAGAGGSSSYALSAPDPNSMALVPYGPGGGPSDPSIGPAIDIDLPMAPTGDGMASRAKKLGTGVRVPLEQQWRTMATTIKARGELIDAEMPGQAVQTLMDLTQSTMKMGAFLMALQFFKAMNGLAKLKKMLSGDEESRSIYMSLQQLKRREEERQAKAALEEEEEYMTPDGQIVKRKKQPRKFGDGKDDTKDSLVKALAGDTNWGYAKQLEIANRAAVHRKAMKMVAETKAAAGFALKAARLAAEAEDLKQARIKHEQKKKRKFHAACTIQRVYRAWRERKKVASELYERHLQIERDKLELASAIKIQRVFRGFMARVAAADYKAELAEFLRFVRDKQAEDVVKAYYDANVFEGAERAFRQGLANTVADKQKLKLRAERNLDESQIVERAAEADYEGKSTWFNGKQFFGILRRREKEKKMKAELAKLNDPRLKALAGFGPDPLVAAGLKTAEEAEAEKAKREKAEADKKKKEEAAEKKKKETPAAEVAGDTLPAILSPKVPLKGEKMIKEYDRTWTKHVKGLAGSMLPPLGGSGKASASVLPKKDDPLANKTKAFDLVAASNKGGTTAVGDGGTAISVTNIGPVAAPGVSGKVKLSSTGQTEY
jgi:IQ calmodulin-binding motif